MYLLSNANALHIPLPDESVQCVVTSPPYFGLRNYQIENQIGLEKTPDEYVDSMVRAFREVRRVLRKDGIAWLNLGDCYSKGSGKQVLQTKNASHGLEGMRAETPSLPSKQLLGIPWRVAFALQADGWYLRSDIVWAKGVSGQKETESQVLDAIERAFSPGMARYITGKLLPELDMFVGNAMPESVRDRPTKAHEYVFLLAKSKRYFYDKWAVVEPLAESSIGRAERFAKAMEKYGTPERSDSKHLSNGVDQNAAYAGLASGRSQGYHKQGRNRRTVWQINTKPFKGAHFATFPPDLIRPMILAGTSEKGCCSECGAPWKRVVESEAATSKHCPKTDAAYNARGGSGEKKTGTIGMSGGGRVDGYTNTIGWEPTCSCDCADTVPCTVLDPFIGSGTTAQVAEELGCNCVGLDLSYSYLQDQAMARLRS